MLPHLHHGCFKNKTKKLIADFGQCKKATCYLLLSCHRFSFGSSTLLLLLFVASLYCAPFLAHCFVFVSLLTYFYCCPLFVMFDFTLPAPYFTSAFLIRCLSFPCPPLCLSPFCVCLRLLCSLCKWSALGFVCFVESWNLLLFCIVRSLLSKLFWRVWSS